MKKSYSFPILLTSLLFVTISLSALNTQVPLWLDHNNIPVWQIGLVSSSYFVGNLMGTIVANWFISKFNVKKTYSYTCLIFAISTIGLSLSLDFYSWAVWRFLIGISCAITWVVIESCILVTGTISTRGKMLAIYMTTYYFGTVLGQALLPYFPNHILYFGLVVAVLLGIAILFISLTHYKLPKRKRHGFNILTMILHKPARIGLVGCLISGMMIGTSYSLLPVYYSQMGFSDLAVSQWMIVLILSGVIVQIPANRLTDKFGRTKVLVVESLLVIVSCGLLFFNIFTVVGVIILGATVFTIYPLSMAWACSSVKRQDIVSMNQAMLLINTLGSLIAPAIISLIMNDLGNAYLFVCFIVISLYFIILLMKKRSIDAKQF